MLFPQAGTLPAAWAGPLPGLVSGAALASIGLAIPAQRALASAVILVEAR